MIKAIIFDCFGVLATEGWIAFKHKHFGSDPAKMRRATELSHLLDSGFIGYDDSLQEIAQMAGVNPAELDRILRNVAPNEELLDYIRDELKPRYRIGMLSNVGDNWLYSIFNDEQIALFDQISLSHESGITKPHPGAYESILSKLGEEAEACLFIDDLEANVTGAKTVGMQGLIYVDFAQLKRELAALLADTKR
jgi:putative hydrolase of the HAD superfamily